MSDLVKRLRKSSATYFGCQGCVDIERNEAADEIERLRAVLKPFADFADLMERNNYRKGADLILRQYGHIIGHAAVQPETMFAARAAYQQSTSPQEIK